MTKQTIAVLGITAALVVAGGTAYAIDPDASYEDLIGACPPGSHFKVTQPNGDTLTIERDIRELAAGSEISSNGITVHQDGTVTARNGEVECIEP